MTVKYEPVPEAMAVQIAKEHDLHWDYQSQADRQVWYTKSDLDKIEAGTMWPKDAKLYLFKYISDCGEYLANVYYALPGLKR